jgi:large subunit ribosomal protein L4
MTSTQVLDLKGKKTGEITLKDEVFGIEPKTGLMHTALVRQLANARSGSANTKTRSEVRGGGAKPWRQKGTGRARAGSRRSPLWEGGGVTFGPKPRDFSISLPKKMRALAVKSALAAKKDQLVVVGSFADVKEPKTKNAIAIYRDLKIEGKKVLLVLDYTTDDCKVITLAARNIEGTKVVHVNNLSVKDLIESDVVLTTETAVNAIHKRFEAQPKAVKVLPPRKPRPTVDPNAAPKAKAKPKAKAEVKAEAKPKAEKAETPKAEKAETPKAKAQEPAEAKPKKEAAKAEAHSEPVEPKAKKAAPKAEAVEEKAKPKKAAKEEETKPAKKSKKED